MRFFRRKPIEAPEPEPDPPVDHWVDLGHATLGERHIETHVPPREPIPVTEE